MIVAIACLVWAQRGNSSAASIAQASSAVTPLGTLRGVAQLAGEADFARFNIPLLSLLVAALWFFAAVSIGAIVLVRSGMSRRLQKLELPLFSFLIGFSLIGTVTLFLGLAGLAVPAVMWAVVVLSCAAGLLQWRHVKEPLLSLPVPVRLPFAQFALRNLIALLLLIAILGAVLYALTPPIQSDAMRYHLGAPQEFLKRGRITYLPLNAFSNFPFLPEMHYMIGLGCSAPEASQLMHLALFLATLLALAAFIQRFVEPLYASRATAAKWLVAACYTGIPAGFVIASWPFIDHAVTLFLFASLYALLLAFQSGDRGCWVLAGTMLGSAIASKYTAVPFALFLGILGLVEWMAFSPPAAANLKRSIRLRNVLLLITASAVIAAPWFIKNVVFTGNPVYPLANSVFKGGDWTAANAKLYTEKMNEKGLPKTPLNVLAAPVDHFINWTPRYEDHFTGVIFPALCVAGVFGGILLLVRHGTRARFAGYLLAGVAFYYLLWFFTYQSNRMLLPLGALLAPLAAGLLLEMRVFSRVLWGVLAAVLLIGAAHGIFWALQWEYVRASPKIIPYLTGTITQQQYRARALTYARAFDELNERVKPGEKVLLVGEHRIYGAKFDAIWSDWFDTPAVLQLIREGGAFFNRHGISHILYNEAELAPQLERYFRPRFSSDEWEMLQLILSQKDRAAYSRRIEPGVYIFNWPLTPRSLEK